MQVQFLFNSNYYSDTWEWNDGTWTERHPANNPPQRYGSAIAYDGMRAVTVLFGGNSPNGYLADTWEYVRQ